VRLDHFARLVALQLLKDTTKPFLFAQVSSRNNIIREFQRRIKEAGGSKGQTYRDYVALLTAVAEKAKLDSPEEIEMVLFANSLSLVSKVAHLMA
jgi:hypothetical protein